MSVLKNMAIKHKLISVIMLTCTAALLLAGTSFIAWEWTGFRLHMVEDLSTHAKMVAENCKAALAFEDAEDAKETLGSLHAKPSVVFGCIYNNKGEIFATYYRDYTTKNAQPSEFREEGYIFGDDLLTMFKPIVLDGETIGTVCLRSDLQPMYAMLKRNAKIIIVVLLIASLTAYFISSRLQKVISEPILNLTESTARIGKGDLNYRVKVQSKDELGHLATSFNEMAGKLKESYAGLEEKVRQRTAELTSANENLQAEIEQRIKVEQTLRESRKELNKQYKFLNSVLESLTHPFYVIDANNYAITMANSAAYPERLPEKATCYLFLYERDKPCEKCLLSKIKKTKEPAAVEHIYYGEDSDPKYVEIHGYPIFDSKGNLSQIIEYSFDITERKKAEQRQAELIKEVEIANQELKDFAYVVSHDLKAPLRGISTLTEWLSTDYRDKFDEEGKQDLDLLLGRAERMQNLIDGILEYSRVGRIEQEKVQVNLNELVSDVIDMVAPPENIKITLENELPVVCCEQTRITQVFENLLSNAIKYMDKPQGQIKISCVEENAFWKFGVADNGPGIEEKHFERIFKIFQTLAPQDKSGSTGIGLTVIKKIVELYGGRIWLESKLGRGSTFYFTLPKQVAPSCDALQNGPEEMGVKDEKLKANIVS